MIGLALGAYDGWQTPALLVVGCVVIGVWIATLVDIFRHSFCPKNRKVLWLLVTTLLPVVGTIIYIRLGGKQKIQ